MIMCNELDLPFNKILLGDIDIEGDIDIDIECKW